MKKSWTHFLYWWIIFSLICVSSIWAWIVGVFAMTDQADFTKLSFLIYILFMIFSIRTGWYFYQLARLPYGSANALNRFEDNQDASWFVSDVLLTLGMLGTIVGIIFAIGKTFYNIDPQNQLAMREALKMMGLGISTALYTTASGLICSTLLKLQLFIFGEEIKSKK